MARVKPFIQLVVGRRVEFVWPGPIAVVAVNDLTHEPTVRFDAPAHRRQLALKPRFQNVRRVEPQTVHTELREPQPRRAEEMLAHFRVGGVELDEVEVTVPALVTEGVPGRAPARKVEKKPVAVGARLATRLHVSKSPEVSPDVVKYCVQHYPQAAPVARRDKRRKVGVAAEPPVDGKEVGGVVTVGARLEHRPEQQRAYA